MTEKVTVKELRDDHESFFEEKFLLRMHNQIPDLAADNGIRKFFERGDNYFGE